jgi:hypothetical protein
VLCTLYFGNAEKGVGSKLKTRGYLIVKGCFAPFISATPKKGSAASSKMKETMKPLLAVFYAKNTQNQRTSESETATV